MNEKWVSNYINELASKDEVVYIDFMNKDIGFKTDRKYFKGKNAYKDAVKWARKNFEKFNPDMISYEKNRNETNEGLSTSENAGYLKLLRMALKAMPGSPKQKAILKQINILRIKGGMKPLKESKTKV
jgi:hypothetical protein